MAFFKNHSSKSSESSTIVSSPVQPLSQASSRPRKQRQLQGVFIPISPSHSLEANLLIPDPKKIPETNKLAILTHPWSWLGGTMNDPVLHYLSSTFLKQDYHVVLYNSRGVGLSSGRSTLTGSGEVADLQGVVEWALKEVINVDTLVLLGYSYGSLITSCYSGPRSPNIKRQSYILLSHALGPVSFLTFFNSARYTHALDTLVSTSSANVLCIFGDSDQFTSAKRYNAWIARLKEATSKRPCNEAGEAISTRCAFQATQIEGADHFWRGARGKEMRRVVADWLTRLDTDTLLA